MAKCNAVSSNVCGVVAWACWLVLCGCASGSGDDGIAFFETKIRPVLVAHCMECHSANSKSLRGKLRLDTAAGVRQGGENGKVIEPGKPDESPLLAALAHDGSFVDMPPKGKLPDSAIADFRRWIAMGAPDPRVERSKESKAQTVVPMTPAEAKRHWAFQPLRKPALPRVRQLNWPRAAVDAFVLAKLEAAKLAPSPIAEPRVLIRRLYFDLVGMPPTYEQVEAFALECAKSPSAFDNALSQLVDRLLASPHYGERWGRHWLDVARYADTKDGVLMYGDARLRPHAFTYRDYVVNAFNADLPFDRFVTEQLAADLMEPKPAVAAQAGMGFLTLGRMFDLNAHDIIDDQIDTVTRGFLGLTVACARCHDHKYDAIPTTDYYALYGVFARSEVPIEPPIVAASNNKAPGFDDFAKKDLAARQGLSKLLDEQFAQLTEFERTHAGDYLFDLATVKADPLENAIFFRSLSPGELRPLTLARWRQHLQKLGPNDPIFGPFKQLLALATTPLAEPDRLDREAPQKLDKPDPGIEKGAAAVLDQLSKRKLGNRSGEINAVVLANLRGRSLRSRGDVASAYRDAFTNAYESHRRGGATPSETALTKLLIDANGPAYFAKSATWYYMSRAEKDRFHGLRTELDILAAKFASAPPRAMCLVDCASPMPEPRVHVRGNPTVLGETVARHFVSILQNGTPKPFGPGSGRLDLAKAIVDPSNPLTARVFVNRVWMHHLGEPLAATPGDFGARGSQPTHPELLDWLAARFIEQGWSIKRLHREIVLSATYLQSSKDRPDCRSIDADNRLLWRANRRRLDFESMRDAMLAASGRLDRRMGGRPADIAADANNARRTIYALVDRQSLPTMFRAFDFANPDQSIDRRPFTTVPQQALFALNSPFVALQSKALAAMAAPAEASRGIEILFERVLARRPTADERALAAAFLEIPGEGLPPAASAGAKPVSRPTAARWEQLAQTLLAGNEFAFCD